MTKDQERMYRFFLGGLTTPEETNALIEADKRSQRSGTTLTFDGRSFDERWAADPERYAVQMGMKLAALNKLTN